MKELLTQVQAEAFTELHNLLSIILVSSSSSFHVSKKNEKIAHSKKWQEINFFSLKLASYQHCNHRWMNWEECWKINDKNICQKALRCWFDGIMSFDGFVMLKCEKWISIEINIVAVWIIKSKSLGNHKNVKKIFISMTSFTQ